MKKPLLSILVLAIASTTFAQTAKLQVIHNSAEPAADTVDIYANGNLLLNDVAFRTATAYLTVDAGVNIELGVAPKTSNRSGGTGAASVIEATKQTINLLAGGTFVGIANGLLSVTKPSATAFQIYASAGSTATTSPNVGLKFFHGASDAPAVDIIARGVATLAPNLSYGKFTESYVPVPASKYVVDINAAGTSTTVISYDVDLSGLAGGSAVVFASGFLSPTGNQKGFAVLAALPSGDVVNFAVSPTASLQVIHNSAEPAADTVDIYANGALLLNDVAFRTATAYLNVPAGVNIELGVAPKTSNRASGTGAASIIAATKQTINLPAGSTFVGIANGLLSVTKPGATAFQIFASAGSKSTTAPNVGLKFFHGASDAPAVDIIARGVATLAPNLSYGKFTESYVPVPASKYVVDINAAGTSTTVISYDVDLSGLAGGSAVVFASGFLSPTGNQKGFAVLAALPDGKVVNFPVANPTGLFIESFERNSNLVYPNPATSSVSINNTNVSSVEFADNSGAVVKSITDNVPSTLDISDLKTGFYVVKVQRNNLVQTVKLSVIQ